MKLSDAEILQLAALLNEQVTMRLNEYRVDSPDLLGHGLSMVDELPGILENCFVEVACLDEINKSIRVAQKTDAFRFQFGV